MRWQKALLPLLFLACFGPLSIATIRGQQSDALLAETNSDQNLLANPSFEGEGRNSTVPMGWFNCGNLRETPPDLHPEPANIYGLTQLPNHGATFLGMVVRDNGTGEAISQLLQHPLEPGSEYSFSIYLARSADYHSISSQRRRPTNFAGPATLVLWGGDGMCSRQEKLFSTAPINHTDWVEYKFSLKPGSIYTHLMLEVIHEADADPYCGNLLLDNAALQKIDK